ncbi:alpha/beta hydrolase [Paucilactobacillus suebicus]|uniref:alpha/beta hydrolase n=1 Tax=Paucilactobacillus suebicus TaxID=152335 RepID=UPI00024903C7|nr:alpha/beta hydrolase [Paucilactobacillus suebicus]
MQIVNHSLKNDTFQTSASLTCYLKDLDPRHDDQQMPAIIFVPGGSFTHIQPQQAENVALAFSAMHYQCFVLNYSLESDHEPLLPFPVLDLARAIQLVRYHAEEWHIDVDKIVPMGFSVGGQVVALFNDFWHDQWFTTQAGVSSLKIQPNAIILGYPVIDLEMGFPDDEDKLRRLVGTKNDFAAQKHVNKFNAPTFTWVTSDDPMVPVANSLSYCTALAQLNIKQELHIFRHGPHGMALATNETAWKPDADQPHVAHWTTLVNEWLTETL